MANKAGKRSRGPAVENVADPDLPLEPKVGEELSPVNEEWIDSYIDPELGFFDAFEAIPEGGWDKVGVYLYRLDPPVANKSGEKKYIAVYGGPITEEMIKTQHGGGKFHAFVKYGTATLRNHRFSIEGPPILLEGQTPRGGGAPQPISTAVPQQNELAAVVRQVIEATGGNSKAADAGIEVMKRAMMDGLELTSSISKKQMESATGSTIGDKLLESLLPRLVNPPTAPTTDPLVLKLLDAVIAQSKADRREPNPTPAAGVPVTDQLALVKELLGVESLAEIVKLGGRGSAETPWWVSLITNGIDRLPALLQEFSQMQERGFQRAVLAHQLGAGQPNAIPAPPGWNAPPAAPMIRPPAPAAPPAAPPMAPGGIPEQMIGAIVDGICRAFDEGYPGDVAGAFLNLSYPQLVESLRPLLADAAQLSSFVSQMPPLAERSRDPEWAEFQADLIAELSQVPAPPPGVIEPPAAPPMAAAAAAGASVSRGTPPGRRSEPKKKPNGAAVA